jgi:serpin B
MNPTDLPAQESEPTQISEEAPKSDVAHSAKERNLSPNISEAELQELSAGNRAFAIDLYQAINGGSDNLFFSPYSISLALAMTYGGAREKTAQQMAETLHFSLPDEVLHAGFNALDLELDSRNNEGDEMMPGFKLNIANSAWTQYDRPFEQAYLDLLAENYDAGLYLTDFVGDPEGSREAINEWVSQETEGKIEDLIPSGAIDALTRLVLANAIYFNATWQNTFEETLTRDAPFTLLDGSQVTVPMMALSSAKSLGYTTGENFEAVELPYSGGQLSMVIFIPDEGSFEAFEASLTSAKLTELLDNMEIKQVELQMPRFGFESEFGLASTLQQMGMQDAFNAQVADFSGMDGTKELFISNVVHKAFVDVDEEGTEAAAATAVIIGVTSMPVTDIQLTIDQPFIFLIQDKPTGSILFLGRVLDPMQ